MSDRATIPACEAIDGPVALALPDEAPAVEPFRADSLAGSVMILIVLTGVQRLVGLVRSVLFCRWLTPEELGLWDVAFGFLMLAAPLSVLAISGSFGRYAEPFRQQGRLRLLVRRTGAFCLLLASAASLLVYEARRWFAELIFGNADQTGVTAALAITLATVIAFNFIGDLFSGLRNARALARFQLVNSVAFAALSVLLLAWGGPSVTSVVLAYGGACVVSFFSAWPALRRIWRASPDAAVAADPAIWSRLLPFAAWIWIGSFLTNLFTLADRYMIVHWAPGGDAQALALVGQYHSSRVIPMLLVSLASMLAGALTPYLIHDWEAGRRAEVAHRLNHFLKLFGLALFAGSVAVLLLAPWLFSVGFRGKFTQGLGVLPWTLTYSVWYGMMMVLQNWLWCQEKARLASLAMGAGLVVNVALNAVVLPRYGLEGAVVSTTLANLVVMLLVAGFNRWLGFRLHHGTLIVLALPATLSGGAIMAGATLVAIACLSLGTNLVFTADEKRQFARRASQWFERREWRAGGA